MTGEIWLERISEIADLYEGYEELSCASIPEPLSNCLRGWVLGLLGDLDQALGLLESWRNVEEDRRIVCYCLKLEVEILAGRPVSQHGVGLLPSLAVVHKDAAPALLGLHAATKLQEGRHEEVERRAERVLRDPIGHFHGATWNCLRAVSLHNQGKPYQGALEAAGLHTACEDKLLSAVRQSAKLVAIGERVGWEETDGWREYFKSLPAPEHTKRAILRRVQYFGRDLGAVVVA